MGVREVVMLVHIGCIRTDNDHAYRRRKSKETRVRLICSPLHFMSKMTYFQIKIPNIVSRNTTTTENDQQTQHINHNNRENIMITRVNCNQRGFNDSCLWQNGWHRVVMFHSFVKETRSKLQNQNSNWPNFPIIAYINSYSDFPIWFFVVRPLLTLRNYQTNRCRPHQRRLCSEKCFSLKIESSELNTSNNG